MNKKRLLALLTGSAVSAVGVVAAISYDRWEWTSLPALVAAGPQSEDNNAKTPPPPATATGQTQTTKTAANTPDLATPPKAVSDSSETVSVPVAPKPSSSTPETKPAAKGGEPREKLAKAEPEPTVDAKSEEKPAPAQTPEVAKQTDPEPEPALPEIPKKPSFDTVRVEKSGEALAAGTAAPGAEIVLKLNGKPVGKTVANKEGAWVIVPDAPLPHGLGQLTAEQKMPGALGSETSDQAVAVVVPENTTGKGPLVALVAPGEPTEVLQKPATEPKKQGSSSEPNSKLPVTLDTVDYNDKGDIVFSGRAGSGANVRLYVDNKPVGDTAAAKDGKWSYQGKSEIPPGNHSLRVDHINESGKVLNRIELPFHREEPERVVALKEPEPGSIEAPAAEPVPAAKVQQPPKPGQTAEVPAETPSTGQSAAPQEEKVAATAPASGTEPLKPRVGKIVIQPGNNLWKLSRVIYGRGIDYTVIYEANRAQIRNPNRIYPGQIFTTPNATPPEKIDPKRKKPFSAEEAGALQ